MNSSTSTPSGPSFTPAESLPDLGKNQQFPLGTLSLQTVAMPKDTNWSGDIFGGWLLSEMDIAGAICARLHAKGRVVTVSLENTTFYHPVKVGCILACYTKILRVGYSSIQVRVEAWEVDDDGPIVMLKMTDGIFNYVALDENRQKRQVPPLSSETDAG